MPKNAQTTLSTVMLILHAQNPSCWASAVWELRTSRCTSGFGKDRGTRDQIANIRWIIEKAREFQKNIYFCFIEMLKALCESQQTGKFLEIGIPDYLICLLINLYAGQKATVRTGHGTMDWFQIGKGVCQGYMLSPCLTYMQSTSCKMLGWMNH